MSSPVPNNGSNNLNTGLLLNRRFRIKRKIGQGGMGQVYEAQDEHLGRRPVAIKVLHPGQIPLEEAAAKILQEALTTGKLSHPHIVKVLDVARIDEDAGIPTFLVGAYFMVMEYVPGETLFQKLREPTNQRREAEWFRIFHDLVRTVRFAHDQEVIHRDLKPGNIIITEHGIKVLDFGIAQADERIQEGCPSGKAPALCSPCGTLCYMPPDLVSALETNQLIIAEKRHDVYALGVILYQILSRSLGSPMLSPSIYQPLCQDHDTQERRFVLKLYDRLIINALGLDSAVKFADAGALDEACSKLIEERTRWEQEESQKTTRRRDEDIVEKRVQRELLHANAQHQKAATQQRRVWIVATAAVFWGGVHLSRLWIEHKELADLATECTRDLHQEHKAIRTDSPIPSLLYTIQKRIQKQREVPEVCIQGALRYRLALGGLQYVEDRTEGTIRSLPVQLSNELRQSLQHKGTVPGLLATSPNQEHGIAASDGDRSAKRFQLPDPNANSVAPTRVILFSLIGEQISGVAIDDGGLTGLIATRGPIVKWSLQSEDDKALVSFKTVVAATDAPVKHLTYLAGKKNSERLILGATETAMYLWQPQQTKPISKSTMRVLQLVAHPDGTASVVVTSGEQNATQHLLKVDPLQLQNSARAFGNACSPNAILANIQSSKPNSVGGGTIPTRTVPDDLQHCFRPVQQSDDEAR